ncbi:ferric reductase [Paenibacillus gansuensis]|uniref:Ferric reductase n=1 Tax=Paenibacillus gansuensis TaxID=306542 RepID=A0ABW5PIQ7_9BACL
MDDILHQASRYLNVWYTSRSAGITSYLLLFVSMISGISHSMKVLPARMRAVSLTLHQSSGWFGLLFGMVHSMVLIYDKYIGYSVSGMLIPFTAHTHPVLTGLGTLAFYGMLLLMLSSDLIKTIGKRAWRTIHMLAFPAFAMALVHGIMLGTDTKLGWVRDMYLLTGGAVAVLTVFRIWLAGKEKTSAKPAGSKAGLVERYHAAMKE